MAESKVVTGAEAAVVLVDEGEGFGKKQFVIRRGEPLPENIVKGEEQRLEKAGAFGDSTKSELRYARLTGSRNVADPTDTSNRPENPVETFDVNLFGPPPGLAESVAETQETGDKNLATFREAQDGVDEEGNYDREAEVAQEDRAMAAGNRRAGSTTADDASVKTSTDASAKTSTDDEAPKKSTKSK